MTGGEYKWRIFKIHLELRDQQLKTIMYIETAIPKPHDNHKPKIYNRYTHKKRKRNPNATLRIIIKSQEKRTKEEGKKKDIQKQTPNN